MKPEAIILLSCVSVCVCVWRGGGGIRPTVTNSGSAPQTVGTKSFGSGADVLLLAPSLKWIYLSQCLLKRRQSPLKENVQYLSGSEGLWVGSGTHVDQKSVRQNWLIYQKEKRGLAFDISNSFFAYCYNSKKITRRFFHFFCAAIILCVGKDW